MEHIQCIRLKHRYMLYKTNSVYFKQDDNISCCGLDGFINLCIFLINLSQIL